MKKHRFLIIAILVSILLHVLLFLFAPKLKSEINSNNYLKKITKISVFQEIVKPEAPKAEINSESNQKSTSRKISKKKKSQKNEEEINNSEIRKEEVQNIEAKNEQKNTENTSKPRDNEITESRYPGNTSAPRDTGITESRNPDNTSAPRNNGITGSRDSDSNSGAPRRAGELAFIPKAINPKTPPYPETLEDEGVEGSVTLELLISKEGKVLKAKVIKSDHELFSESALRTVKNYKFSPGKLADGSAADSLIEFVIKFEISL